MLFLRIYPDPVDGVGLKVKIFSDRNLLDLI